ncbi:hypothetical protein [Ideonella sp. BN130291]|uniref:hypothetical protein n=1 Tax=Ideonella sp. BN130291 TaxID=3112940 RepID=UPI002E25B3C6|nr:hypothetical protein [Ideonella sp. BN130291]
MPAAAPAGMPPVSTAARLKPLFEYVGATALTVIGPASGLRYRFDRPGARLAVDPRDRIALEAVPLLRARQDDQRRAAA